MKNICLLASLILTFSTFSQRSYYFSNPLPADEDKITNVAERYYGIYESKDGSMRYQFNENGVLILSTVVSSVSRETVRESSQYSVRNGYIFGVVEGDSIPCILEGESYYFGIRNTDVFVGIGSMNVLVATQSSSQYVINLYEGGNYIPMLIEFQGNKLTIRQFDYEGEGDEFPFISEKKSVSMEHSELIIMNAEKGDFEELKEQGFFRQPMVLKI